MRIAVTYDNGNVFPHFGRTQQFKLYDVEGGKVTSSRVIGTNGVGHGALAVLLASSGVDTLVCGGLGGGALLALSQVGIKVYGGASGPADGAVAAFLAGQIPQTTEASCGCHGHGHGDGGGHMR